MQNLNATRLEALVREAARARQSGDFATALAIAGQAAQEHLAHPLLLRLQAEALAVAGRYAEAGRLLNRALALAPNDALTITDIGRVLVAENRVEEAIRAFEAAVTVRPELAAAWLELGLGARDRWRRQCGAHRLRAGEVARPGRAEASAALATIALRRGDAAAGAHARGGGATAAGRSPRRGPRAGEHRSRSRRRRGGARAARGATRSKVLDERQQQVALGRLGDALDRLGRTAEAFAAYTRMNEETVRVAAPRFDDGGRIESHLEFVAPPHALVRASGSGRWRPAVAAGAERVPCAATYSCSVTRARATRWSRMCWRACPACAHSRSGPRSPRLGPRVPARRPRARPTHPPGPGARCPAS